jgi:hypothetical protein
MFTMQVQWFIHISIEMLLNANDLHGPVQIRVMLQIFAQLASQLFLVHQTYNSPKPYIQCSDMLSFCLLPGGTADTCTDDTWQLLGAHRVQHADTRGHEESKRDADENKEPELHRDVLLLAGWTTPVRDLFLSLHTLVLARMLYGGHASAAVAVDGLGVLT